MLQHFVRVFVTGFGLCLFGCAGLAADDPQIPPFPHKVFVDTQNNKLFWPMDKPFWVRLATSPDENAPSFLLQRVTPESDITTEKYNKEGIELEIRGKQFIRWFNYATKHTVMLQFFSDGDPPTTKATCTGAPTATVGQHVFYGRGLHCSLAAEDELSGVDKIYYSLNGKPYEAYSHDMPLDREQDVVFRYFSVDRVGYAEKPSMLAFTVDVTAPATKHAIAGTAIGDVLSSKARFEISPSDALSGVSTVWARFDNQEFRQIADGIAVDALAEGDHTLSYYSIDRVNNRETEHKIPFYLDRTPPTVDYKVLGDQYSAPDGTRYISGRTEVGLTAKDNKIGVDTISYSFDGSKYQVFSSAFRPPTRSGPGKVVYQAADKLGNTSTPATLPYVMDLAPSASSYRFAGPTYQLRSDYYITKDTKLELSSSDDTSGVQKIEYQVEGENSASTYRSPLSFANEGRILLRYWGTDRVNNRETDKAVVLIIDNTAPEIFANFSIAPTVPAGQSPAVYRRNTNLFLGATDNAAGVRRITYSFDNGKEVEYRTPLVLDRPGTYDLSIRAEDNVGNQSTKRLRFTVRD